jgi:Fur family ferric uptake transcriptional regulator
VAHNTPPNPCPDPNSPPQQGQEVVGAQGEPLLEEAKVAVTTETAIADSVESAYQRCRDLGLRLSKQRRMVLQLLWAEKTHLSARDIFEKLNNLGRNIGHTSVYQNLESLQAAGVIECLDRASGRLYGYRADPHSHLTCLDSGDIHDLDVCLPPLLLHQIERQTGFMIEAYTLNLLGRRRPC